MPIDSDLGEKADLAPFDSEREEQMPAASAPARWPLLVIVVGLITSLAWTIALVWLAIRLIF
jgi:hypothetical protein